MPREGPATRGSTGSRVRSAYMKAKTPPDTSEDSVLAETIISDSPPEQDEVFETKCVSPSPFVHSFTDSNTVPSDSPTPNDLSTSIEPLPFYDKIDGEMLERPTPDLNTVVRGLNILEANLNYQKTYNLMQNDKIRQLENRISQLEGDLTLTKARFCVTDHVIDALRGEVSRLQQFTRRYTVSVTGIPKQREEKDNPDILREKVHKLISEVKSTTKEDDIDKFHRNGRVTDGNEQEILIRFKSHAAKESFYRARKSLPPSMKEIKIRPSLSRHQSDLLRDAKAVVEQYNYSMDEVMVNPVEFVLANIHGDIQVKMKNKVRGSQFISFNSVQDLCLKLQQAQVVEQTDTAFDIISSRIDRADQMMKEDEQPVRPLSGDDDDMGFDNFI